MRRLFFVVFLVFCVLLVSCASSEKVQEEPVEEVVEEVPVVSDGSYISFTSDTGRFELKLYKEDMSVQLKMDGKVIDTGHWTSVSFEFMCNMFLYLDNLPFDFEYDPPSTEYRLYVDYEGVKDTLRCHLNTWYGKLRGLLSLEESSGEIICYGSSNFIYWQTMKKDLAPYPVHQHTAGLSSAKQLIKYAPEALYAYDPSIVILHLSTSNAEEFVELTEEFHKNLPDTVFIATGSVPTPSSIENAEKTIAANKGIEDICNQKDYLVFCDFVDLVYNKETGEIHEEYFMSDGLHLNRMSRIEIANRYLLPILDELTKGN